MNKTTSHTAGKRATIPVLTAENYGDVVRDFGQRPVPADIGEIADIGANGIGTLENYDQVALDDGTPTEWRVDALEGTLTLKSAIHCSVANCAGHTGDDLEGTWLDLSHTTAVLSTEQFANGQPDRQCGLFRVILRNGGDVLSYLFTLEGEQKLDEVEALALHFEDVAAQLRAFMTENSEKPK